MHSHRYTLTVECVGPDGNALQTGVSYTGEDAKEAFEECRKYNEDDPEKYEIILDLREGGWVVDTISFCRKHFRSVTGHFPKSPGEYAEYDTAFWSNVRESMEVANA